MSRKRPFTNPRARTQEIVVHELSDEILIYDLKRHEAHCLNQVARLIWKHCDGQTSVAKIVEILEQEFGTQVDEEIVWYALKRLEKSHLLSESLNQPSVKAGLSRREVMKKLGWAAAVSLPLITTIGAPTTTQAQSCRPRDAACTINSQCCSGNCRGNGTCA